MSKRMLINYLLIVLIVIFTWIGIKFPIREDQLIDRDAITTLKPQNITHIKIETADGTIEINKQGQVWQIDNPVHWYANNVAAERLASLAGVHPQSKLPRTEIDISTLGLRIPKAVVTLNNTAVYFGDTNRIGNRRYLMVDPNVFLVSDVYYPFISQGLNSLIDERLLPSHLALKSLAFSGFKLEKDATGWHSDKPEDSTAAEQLINHWQRNAATRISRYNEGTTPLQKITATLQNDTEINFFLLSIKPQIVIARPDLKLAYHFAEHDYYNLLELEKPHE